ncbi:MAG: hypothetical protein HQL72_11465 [Magnetococcales bacterium]|nr:hypothetical protein [Magnetococcales bacterium]
MGEPKIFFCEACNPEKFHQKDRRKHTTHQPSAQIIPFPTGDRRENRDRRQIPDRRIVEKPHPKTASLRRSIGRRPFDGHAWFIGTVDRAIDEKWLFKKDGERLICPRCSYKMG